MIFKLLPISLSDKIGQKVRFNNPVVIQNVQFKSYIELDFNEEKDY